MPNDKSWLDGASELNLSFLGAEVRKRIQTVKLPSICIAALMILFEARLLIVQWPFALITCSTIGNCLGESFQGLICCQHSLSRNHHPNIFIHSQTRHDSNAHILTYCIQQFIIKG